MALAAAHVPPGAPASARATPVIVYLVRHAQSENNALADAAKRDPDAPGIRVADPPLTKTGEAQALRVAEHLRAGTDKTDRRDDVHMARGFGIDRLYASPMLRALHTAQAIAAALKLRPEVWLDIHEEGGIWGEAAGGGLTRSAMRARFPGFGLPDGVTEAGWWRGAAETAAAFAARAVRVAAAIRAARRGVPGDAAHEPLAWRPGERIAIVTHGGFANSLIQTLLGGGRSEGAYLSNHNTAVTRLDLSEERVFLRYQNRVDHLPNELVT